MSSGSIQRNPYQEIPQTFEEILHIQPKKVGEVYLKHYWKILLMVATFYAIPSVQFVVVQYNERAKYSDQVYCYYNFKCANTVLGLAAFNNIISNLGYIILGIIYLLFIRTQDKDEDLSNIQQEPPSPKLTALDAEAPLLESKSGPRGLHRDFSLYYCLGWTLVLEGIFSALYHVCPSRINFQFDTTFMIIGSALLFMTLYQKRQPTIISGPYKTFGFFGGLIFMNVISLLFDQEGAESRLFWAIVLVGLTWISINGSIHLYYFERLQFDRDSILAVISRILRPSRPRAPLRFAAILFANMMNYAYTISTAIKGYRQLATQDFPSFVLALITLNNFVYLIYYIVMKYRSKERVYIRVWISLVLTISFCVVAMYFYNVAVTNKFLTPDESEELNRPCVLFGFFDDHDVWHFLSSLGVFFFFLMVFMLDMDTNKVTRSELKVF